jgi:hypothetical protein
VLRAVFRDEAIESLFGGFPAFGLVDRVQVFLRLALHRRRQLVENVGRFVNPAALLPGFGPDLVQRLPEAQAAIAGGELGVDLQAVLVAQPEQQLAP